MQLNYFPYDFHMHSNFSDGSLAPDALINLANECGITHLSLTDHDTLGGLSIAAACAKELDLQFTAGVEVSAEWNGKVIHVLGLDVETEHQRLVNLLKQTQELRYERLLTTLEKLKRGRITIPQEQFPKVEGVSYGRMHVAMALVEHGVTSKLGSAFKQYLARGQRGYVPTQWPGLEDVVSTILAAGGIPVIAHPRRYKISFKRLTELVSDFKALGGLGIELATASQSSDDQRLIYSLVQQFDLLISQGSDFHHPGGYIQPGKTGGVPEGRYVWDEFKKR